MSVSESESRNGSTTRGRPSGASDRALIAEFAATRSPALREQVIARYMPLARSLALRYRAGGESVDDLVQVANLGLIKAVDRFDISRGKPFAGFAVPTILGELRRHFRDHVWNLRLPRALQELTMKVDSAVEELTTTLGRPPTPKQIADSVEIDVESVLSALAAGEARRTLSLDTPRPGDEDATPAIDHVGTEERGFDTVEAQFASHDAQLDDRALAILKMRVVKQMTQREVGKALGISQMQVSRISRRALWSLLSAVRGEEQPAAGPRPAARECDRPTAA